MKKLLKLWIIGALIGTLAGPSTLFAAASGNYTDLLPPGAASDTTVISRGSGWALTTLPPTQTFGDSLSRLVDTVYQSTTNVTLNTTAVSTFTSVPGVGFVGSTTFPATWVAAGRSMRVTIKGNYTTNTSNWTWGIKLGTTTVITTPAQAAVGSQTSQFFSAVGLITVASTGNTGTVNATYDIQVTSGTVPFTVVSYSTAATGVSVDLTSQLTVNPTFLWGTAGSSITARNISVEFLN